MRRQRIRESSCSRIVRSTLFNLQGYRRAAAGVTQMRKSHRGAEEGFDEFVTGW